MIRVLFLVLCLCSVTARGDEAALASLSAILDGIQRLQGNFVQHQYDIDGAELAVSSGSFKLLRPGYFAWDIQAPDSQLVIAEPEYIWHHDRDLDTVTRRPANGDASLSPLQVLGGEEGALEENYTVEAGEGTGQFILSPRVPAAGFTALTLGFAQGQLQQLSFVDNLGQRVDIHLQDLDDSSGLSSTDFAFTPPPGADLFYHDQ